jgi:hypothetical protein
MAQSEVAAQIGCIGSSRQLTGIQLWLTGNSQVVTAPVTHDLSAPTAHIYRLPVNDQKPETMPMGQCQRMFETLWTHAYEIIRRAPCPVLSFSMEQGERESLSRDSQEIELKP